QCTDLSLRASSTFSRCSANPGTTSLSTPLNLVVAAPTSALVIVSQPLRASCLAGLSPVAAAVAAAAPIGSDLARLPTMDDSSTPPPKATASIEPECFRK